MFEAAYRRRLETDLTTWQNDGVIPPATADAIRAKLGPMPKGINIPTVVGILGALLIAAAFLTFVAANWTEIARPLRFAVLLVGIAGAYALGAWFDRRRPRLSRRHLRGGRLDRVWRRHRAHRPDVSSERRLFRGRPALGGRRAVGGGADRLARRARGGAGDRLLLERHARVRRRRSSAFCVHHFLAGRGRLGGGVECAHRPPSRRGGHIRVVGHACGQPNYDFSS